MKSLLVVGNIKWWRLFCNPFIFSDDNKKPLVPIPTTTAYCTPLIYFLCVVFVGSFLLYSNPEFLERIVENAKLRASTNEDYGNIELWRSGNQKILENPALKIWISFKVLIHVLLSYSALVLIIWFGMSIFTDRWELFLHLWLIASSTLSILLLGWVALFILRSLLIVTDENISFILLLPYYDPSNLLHKLLSQIDLFNLWFLFVLSSRIAYLYNEKRIPIVGLLFLLFIITVIPCYLCNIPFLLL